MVQEEETRKCSNSNIGGGGGFSSGNTGRYSKKQRQKKVPQRGLGVAQLEKMRLEEQLKDESIAPPPVSPTTPSYLPSYQPFSSPNSILEPQNVDVDRSNAVPLLNSMGWQSIPVPVQVHAHVPKLWNSYHYNLKKESLRSSLNFPYDDPNSIWSLPSLILRSQKHQLPASSVSSSSSSTSMMNVPSESSSSLSMNLQMEPPSNQNFYVDHKSTCPEEEKMAGMKRPYPFSLDTPPRPFHCKQLPPTLQHVGRSEDQTNPFGNRGNLDAKTGNLISFRVGSSDPSLDKMIEENGVASEFLTLGPPKPTFACLNSNFDRPSSCLAYHNLDTLNFGSVPLLQAKMEDTILGTDPNVSNQEQSYYSFLTPTAMQNGEAANTYGNYNAGELGEKVDLNLRL